MRWCNPAGWFGRGKTAADVCFCTLAIHAPYRARARSLCADLMRAPMLVLTDEPGDFSDLPVRTVRHSPTGPMAREYLERLPVTGNNRGAAAYHDKRFALQAALRDFGTAVYLDADTRIAGVPPVATYPSGLSVTTVVRRSVAEHLDACGTWRASAFRDLANELTGGLEVLRTARWCHEACFAVTKDGREDRFFSAWDKAAGFLQRREVFSGEGGVIGLAAACAGWSVNYEAIEPLAAVLKHEGGGPKGG
jgi:hypothetical protein